MKKNPKLYLAFGIIAGILMIVSIAFAIFGSHHRVPLAKWLVNALAMLGIMMVNFRYYCYYRSTK